MHKKYILVPLLLISAFIDADSKKVGKAAVSKAATTRLNPLSGTANVISNNAGDGVLLTNGVTGNTVTNNAIGTDLSTQRKMGNGGAGVHINVNSSNNFIGSFDILTGNVIANNHKGVIVGDSATDISNGNAILNNSIYNNTLPGIDLANDGPTPNHPYNPFTGPNAFQNFPVIESVAVSGSGLVINWTIHTATGAIYELQFFSNNANDPEGKQLIADVQTTTDANGNASGSTTVGPVPLNTPITATATNITAIKFGVNSQTSEFSPGFIYGVSNPCPVTCGK